MATAHRESVQVFAREIARYSDAELDEYLEENGRLVDVEDPGNLPEDFIQRLRDRASTSNAINSTVVDSHDLAQRLEAVPRRSPSSTASINSEESYRHDLEQQEAFHNILLAEGGPPSHPASLGRDILENPGAYCDIISYWQESDKEWKVFESQLGRWRAFRTWQDTNRAGGRFPNYTIQVKDDLEQFGFPHPFQLDEIPERQDRLTTWIEYLGYEYWWFARKSKSVERRQGAYDEAWKTLKDAGILRPSDTEDYVWSIESVFERAGELDRAERDVDAAKAWLGSVRETNTGIWNPKVAQEEANETKAQSRLNTARKYLESVKARNAQFSEFRQITKQYRINKKEVRGRSVLLGWIVDQVPFFEIDQMEAGVFHSSSGRASSGKQSSKRERIEDLVDERAAKHQRRDFNSNAVLDPTAQLPNVETHKRKLSPGSNNLPEDKRASSSLRLNDRNSSLESSEPLNQAPISEAPNPTSVPNPTPPDSSEKLQKKPSAGSSSAKMRQSRKKTPGVRGRAGSRKKGRESK